MDETARDPAAPSPRLLPSCYRCGTPLVGSPVAACPRCVERLRQPIGPRLLGLARWRIRTLIALIAVVASMSVWGIHAWRCRLADDRGQFYTHEEMAQYQAFLKQVALGQVRDA